MISRYGGYSSTRAILSFGTSKITEILRAGPSSPSFPSTVPYTTRFVVTSTTRGLTRLEPRLRTSTRWCSM